jgi:hypothetical protein
MLEASVNASDAAFWQQRVALALGARKIGASHAAVTGVAKQLARLAVTAALVDTVRITPAPEAASDFTQALQACSGT